VKDSGFAQIPGSEDGKKDHMLETIIRIPLKGSEIRPLIIVIEDLHWIDKSSEEALKNLLESISGARILLIFTYRPEYVHTWGGRSYHNQVNLNRLSNRESLAMVNHLMGEEEITANLKELILEKTEGVPFFIEEFIKSLIDLKVIEREGGRYHLSEDIRNLAIPSTIQDVIMARVDSLDEGAKRVIQVGSAIEREFSYQLIKKITGLSEKELLSSISILKDSELLFERGIFPESILIFKHAVTREVVYESILSARKQKFHEDIGNAIEELYKDNVEEYYGVLAAHYIAGRNFVKGAECCRLAMRQSLRAVSFNEAAIFTEKWIDCLEQLPSTEEAVRKIIDARSYLGLHLLQLGYYREAKEAVDPAVDLALRHDYKRRMAQIYSILGAQNLYIEEDFLSAIDFLEKAIKIGEETGDLRSLIWANHNLGHVYVYSCKFEKGLFYLEKALEIPKMGNVLWSIAMHIACIAMNVYYNQGKIDLAYKTGTEGLRLADESGDIIAKAEGYVNHGICCWGKGLIDEAEDHLLKGLAFSRKCQAPQHELAANSYLADIYCFKGNYLKAIDHCSDLISFLKTTEQTPSGMYQTELVLAKAQLMNGEKIDDLETLYSYPAKNKLKIFDGRNKRFLGEILLNLDNEHLEEAEEWINKAIKADTENGMPFELGLDRAFYSELFKRQNNLPQAREQLTKAITIMKECGADG